MRRRVVINGHILVSSVDIQAMTADYLKNTGDYLKIIPRLDAKRLALETGDLVTFGRFEIKAGGRFVINAGGRLEVAADGSGRKLVTISGVLSPPPGMILEIFGDKLFDFIAYMRRTGFRRADDLAMSLGLETLEVKERLAELKSLMRGLTANGLADFLAVKRDWESKAATPEAALEAILAQLLVRRGQRRKLRP
jgi:hypothetical protein